jgi:hypothetical protein
VSEVILLGAIADGYSTDLLAFISTSPIPRSLVMLWQANKWVQALFVSLNQWTNVLSEGIHCFFFRITYKSLGKRVQRA